MQPPDGSKLNPYGHFLGDQQPEGVMKATPERLRELAPRLTRERATRSYAPGKWTAREILCHLADCEIAFSFRLRQAAAETDHRIQPFDQDAWARPYGSLDGAQAIEVFCALRGWNLAFVQSLPADIRAKGVTHPERGTMTFGTILQTMGGHDLNHLKQLESIAGED